MRCAPHSSNSCREPSRQRARRHEIAADRRSPLPPKRSTARPVISRRRSTARGRSAAGAPAAYDAARAYAAALVKQAEGVDRLSPALTTAGDAAARRAAARLARARDACAASAGAPQPAAPALERPLPHEAFFGAGVAIRGVAPGGADVAVVGVDSKPRCSGTGSRVRLGSLPPHARIFRREDTCSRSPIAQAGAARSSHARRACRSGCFRRASRASRRPGRADHDVSSKLADRRRALRRLLGRVVPRRRDRARRPRGTRRRRSRPRRP